MCGIAGFAGWSPRRDAASALRSMCDAIRHRGPDDAGYFVEPGIALGMRRLSIIDRAGGKQPIENEDGSITVVFNGEIYNHHELRARLEHRGHHFKTKSDTETLVHLYEEYGDALVTELRGMFAFALWDARRQRLVIARDRLGIKPLYYWPLGEGLAFASEIGALASLTDLPPIDPSSIARYLAFGYVPEPGSIYAAIKKLPPAHVLSWTAPSGSCIRRYWSPVVDERRDIDEREAVEELKRLLNDAVRSHLESEVPLGAFLSGGIDSSTVVALMTRSSERQVQTFAIGFDDPTANEAPYAASVARALGTKHREVVVRPDVEALIDDIVGFFDEPFGDSSAVPTFLVSRLAKEHVTVALSGDGGDELFGGYTRFERTLNGRELPEHARRILRATARYLPHVTPGRARLLDLGRARQGRYVTTVALPLESLEGGLAAPTVAARVGSFTSLLDPWFKEAAQRDFATQMMLVDTLTYLPGDILTKVDRTSMSVSLESRVPLLDHPLVEFAMSLPSRLKIRRNSGKWILRQAIAELVPRAVLDRAKHGFSMPIGRWMRGPLRYRIDGLLRPASSVREFVDAKALRRIITEHHISRRDHSAVLWRLLVLDIFLSQRTAPRVTMLPSPSVGGLGRYGSIVRERESV